MSVTSGFFNSLNGDRKYNAEQMSAIFDGIINNGVFASIGTAFGVRATTGNNITVGIGRAWFNSTWLYNDSILPLTGEDAEVVLNRYDAVVIEIDHSQAVRAGSIKIIKGTPGSTAQKPAMASTDYVHQYPLAYIYRPAGSSSISQANIENRVGTSECPYITAILQVTNIDNIVAQWQGEWDTWSGQWPQWEAAWNQWFAEQTYDVDQETTQWMAQMQSNFEAWFNALQVILDGDVAANLSASVVDLQERFRTLAEEKAVYETIQDSSDDILEDSNGNPIEGRTVMGGGADSITAQSLGVYTKEESDARFAGKPIMLSIELLSAAWSDNRQEVIVPGVSGDEMAQKITVAPSMVSRANYRSASIECVEQSINSLTFYANKIPESNLTVLITIEEVAIA